MVERSGVEATEVLKDGGTGAPGEPTGADVGRSDRDTRAGGVGVFGASFVVRRFDVLEAVGRVGPERPDLRVQVGEGRGQVGRDEAVAVGGARGQAGDLGFDGVERRVHRDRGRDAGGFTSRRKIGEAGFLECGFADVLEGAFAKNLAYGIDFTADHRTFGFALGGFGELHAGEEMAGGPRIDGAFTSLAELVVLEGVDVAFGVGGEREDAEEVVARGGLGDLVDELAGGDVELVDCGYGDGVSVDADEKVAADRVDGDAGKDSTKTPVLFVMFAQSGRFLAGEGADEFAACLVLVNPVNAGFDSVALANRVDVAVRVDGDEPCREVGAFIWGAGDRVGGDVGSGGGEVDGFAGRVELLDPRRLAVTKLVGLFMCDVDCPGGRFGRVVDGDVGEDSASGDGAEAADVSAGVVEHFDKAASDGFMGHGVHVILTRDVEGAGGAVDGEAFGRSVGGCRTFDFEGFEEGVAKFGGVELVERKRGESFSKWPCFHPRGSDYPEIVFGVDRDAARPFEGATGRTGELAEEGPGESGERGGRGEKRQRERRDQAREGQAGEPGARIRGRTGPSYARKGTERGEQGGRRGERLLYAVLGAVHFHAFLVGLAHVGAVRVVVWWPAGLSSSLCLVRQVCEVRAGGPGRRGCRSSWPCPIWLPTGATRMATR